MTEFVKREFEELEKFQQRVSQYGLEVNKNSFGGYYEGDSTDVFVLCMTTKPQPVKGNKKLIEQLKQDGFRLRTQRHEDRKTGREYMIFIVDESARIENR
jgi:hypothetical protein